jgi:hypothetical protein
MVEAKTDYASQLLKSDVFQHVVNHLNAQMRLDARKLNKKVAQSTVNNMFTDPAQGRLKIDMDAPHNEDTHPIFRKMKNVALMELDDLDLSPEQLLTMTYLGSCFGASVRHLKLVFNGGTQDSFNSKAWLEAFSQF